MHPFTECFLAEISKRDVFHPISNQDEVLEDQTAKSKRAALDEKVDNASAFLNSLAASPKDLDPKELETLKIIAETARYVMFCSDHFQEITWSKPTSESARSPGTVLEKMVDAFELIGKLKPFIGLPFEKAFNNVAAQLICAMLNVHALALAYTKNFAQAKDAINEALTFSEDNQNITEILKGNLERIEKLAATCKGPSEKLILVSYQAAISRGRVNSSPVACAEELSHGIARLDINRRSSFVK